MVARLVGWVASWAVARAVAHLVGWAAARAVARVVGWVAAWAAAYILTYMPYEIDPTSFDLQRSPFSILEGTSVEIDLTRGISSWFLEGASMFTHVARAGACSAVYLCECEWDAGETCEQDAGKMRARCERDASAMRARCAWGWGGRVESHTLRRQNRNVQRL